MFTSSAGVTADRELAGRAEKDNEVVEMTWRVERYRRIPTNNPSHN